MYTFHTYKVSLSPYDDKRYRLDNERDTYVYSDHTCHFLLLAKMFFENVVNVYVLIISLIIREGKWFRHTV